MLNTKIILLCFLFLGAECISADEFKPENAVGFDLYGISYNQYAVSYERLIFRHLSLGITLGYSPEALFNFYGSETNYTSYFLFQADTKSYILSDQMKDLYVGCGVQMDFAPNPLSFKFDAIQGTSSAVLAVFADIGWKFPLNGDKGFYVDPTILFYTAVPVGGTINPDRTTMVWGYKLWAPMMSVNFGYMF